MATKQSHYGKKPANFKQGYRENDVMLSGYVHTFEDFKTNPVTAKAAGGVAGGTAGDINVMLFERNAIAYSPKGTQTITAPVLTAVGLDIGMDQTDNDGVELGGSAIDRARNTFTIGTSEPFFLSVRFKIEDVSGTDDCAIGFRKTQASQANFDDYTDAATLNVISGDVFIETILNNAATTSTDTTSNWADTETHTLTVKVAKDGKALYEIDGTAPTTTAAFTFDSGDVVHPFMFMLNAIDLVGKVEIISWECGLQELRSTY